METVHVALERSNYDLQYRKFREKSFLDGFYTYENQNKRKKIKLKTKLAKTKI